MFKQEVCQCLFISLLCALTLFGVDVVHAAEQALRASHGHRESPSEPGRGVLRAHRGRARHGTLTDTLRICLDSYTPPPPPCGSHATCAHLLQNLDEETTGALNGGAAPVLEDSALYGREHAPDGHHGNDMDPSSREAPAANISRGESFVSAAMYV